MTLLSVNDALSALGAATSEITNGGPALTGVSIDTREDMRGKAFVAIRGERHDGHDFLAVAIESGAALLVVDREGASRVPPGIRHALVDDTRLALAQLARRWRGQLHCQVAAITGSAGKTTTRRLLVGALGGGADVVSSPKSFNNEIGVPLTILSARSGTSHLIVEVGTNHPGEIAALGALTRPNIAIITTVGRAHLEGLGSVEAVAAEKASLLGSLAKGGVAILNGDNAPLRNACAKWLQTRPDICVTTFGCGPASDWILEGRKPMGERGQSYSVRHRQSGQVWHGELALHGEHNALNAAAALAAASAMGVATAEALRGMEAVRPAEMRFTPMKLGQVTVYNDAYNANPESTLASIRTFAEVTQGTRRIVCLGDMRELGGASAALHEEVGRVLARAFEGGAPDFALFVGEHSARTACAFASVAGVGARYTHHGQMSAEAIDQLASLVLDGDSILLKGSRGSAVERLLGALQPSAASDVAGTTPPSGAISGASRCSTT